MAAGLDPGLFAGQPAHRFARGEILFRQGAPTRAVFFLRDGRVRMLRHTVDGQQVTLHVAQAGDVFAEASLFSSTYRCDAVAESPCTVLSLRKDILRRRLKSEPELALHLAERLAHQLHGARTLLELRNIRSAEERAFAHLRLLSEGLKKEERILTLSRPLIELAADLGLTHEAYYRALAALQRRGLIVREGRRAIRVMQQKTDD